MRNKALQDILNRFPQGEWSAMAWLERGGEEFLLFSPGEINLKHWSPISRLLIFLISKQSSEPFFLELSRNLEGGFDSEIFAANGSPVTPRALNIWLEEISQNAK